MKKAKIIIRSINFAISLVLAHLYFTSCEPLNMATDLKIIAMVLAAAVIWIILSHIEYGLIYISIKIVTMATSKPKRRRQ